MAPPGRPRIRQGLAALIAVTAIAAVATVAVHTNSSSARAAGARAHSVDVADDELWQCLSDRAHLLVSSSEPVQAVAHGLGNTVNLEAALAPWADLVTASNPDRTVVVMAPGTGPGSCQGLVVHIRPSGRT